MLTRNEILRNLRAQINVNGHILGAVAGSGMTAKYLAMGGVDFLLSLSAGRFRVNGRSSFASYLCFGNSNQIAMELGTRELIPLISDIPILFGICASDPKINLYDYIQKLKYAGFSGLVNFPTVALIDGQFREALDEEGITYQNEVEAVKIAHFHELFTVAFVTNEEEARMMTEAGADVICVHLGLTKGGFLGAKKYISINDARVVAESIFSVCDSIRPDVIKMVYSGPANTPIDMQYMYQNTKCEGYIGGSVFDRIPTERAILNTTKSFKSYGSFDSNDPLYKVINGQWHSSDCVDFVKRYISEHYMKEIRLRDLALVAHVSESYLSTKFKKEVGSSFTEYLVRFRMNKANEILKSGNQTCKEAASAVGYEDYAQFSRMFKKYIGVSPTEVRNIKETKGDNR